LGTRKKGKTRQDKTKQNITKEREDDDKYQRPMTKDKIKETKQKTKF
jgi:hypothetical protein